MEVESKKPIQQRHDIWDRFTSRWPIESLPNMTLSQYTRAGDKDCFTYWLEAETAELGSIWGGSAFKSGIYARNSDKVAGDARGRKYSEKYGWYAKYGDDEETAFQNVRAEVIKVAEAARNGDLDAIDSVDLGEVYKWKIAFLYQAKEKPILVPIFKGDFLRLATNSPSEKVSTMQRELMQKLGGRDIFEFRDAVWEELEPLIRTELTAAEAKEFFEGSQLFTAGKSTEKLAFFITAEGRQIALELTSKKVKLFLSSGPWTDRVSTDIGEIEEYPAGRARHSNLEGTTLAVGNAIVKVRVPNRGALIALCDAYTDSEQPINQKKEKSNFDARRDMTPLNQIFFGPPGTGKTYTTINAALEILDPEFLELYRNDRKRIKARFDELVKAEQVCFTTFHQSYSYEDFVEGIRADVNKETKGLTYYIANGVFKEFCLEAKTVVAREAEAPIDLKDRNIWKMSLGNSNFGSDSYIYDECIENGYVLLGWGGLNDFSNCKSREDIEKHFAGKNETAKQYMITAVNTFLFKMKIGDLVVVTEGLTKFRAIGEITSGYKVSNREESGDGYGQCREVRWLRVYEPSLPYNRLMSKQFSQATIYRLNPGSIDIAKLTDLLHSKDANPMDVGMRKTIFKAGQFVKSYKIESASNELVVLRKPNGKSLPIAMSILNSLYNSVVSGKLTIQDISDKKVFDLLPNTDLEPHMVNGYVNVIPALIEIMVSGNELASRERSRSPKVFIIDEINRGNVSRIFGELITLIEPSKRAGADETLEAILPYSKKSFTVPNNIYIIGTMNTTDRSLSGLDIALRRRFVFREMTPLPDLLDGVVIDGIELARLLTAMNDRIEVLLDRDHRIGHSYFMDLSGESTVAELAFIFRNQVFPLLQEYFFEDWRRIAMVLNCGKGPGESTFISQSSKDWASLFGPSYVAELNELDVRWEIQEHAFLEAENYVSIYGGT